MRLKIILGLVAIGFLILARGLKLLQRSQRELKIRRKRWDEWGEEEEDDA